MAIRVNPKMTQSENLMNLVKLTGIKNVSVLPDIEGFSVFRRNKTINNKSYNTELHLHIVPDSQTHYKEKKSFAETNYNRVNLGFENDAGFTFVYSEADHGEINLDDSVQANEKLTKMVNEFEHFSQDIKFPFRAELSSTQDSVTVFSHAASPCYIGSKEYALRVKKSILDYISLQNTLSSRLFYPYNENTDTVIRNSNEEDITSTTVKYNQADKMAAPHLEDLVHELLLMKNDLLFDSSYFVNKDNITSSVETLAKSEKAIKYLSSPTISYTINHFDNPVWLETKNTNSVNLVNLRIRNTPHYDEVINIDIIQKHLSSLFIKFLTENQMTLNVPFVRDDVEGYRFSLPSGQKISAKFNARKTNNPKYGLVIDFTVLNGLGDIVEPNLSIPQNHSYFLLLRAIYPEFIEYVRRHNTSLADSLKDFRQMVITDTQLKQELQSDNKDNLIEFGLGDRSLFIGGKLYINCQFYNNSTGNVNNGFTP